MSVLDAVPVEFKRFSGWVEQQMPEGYWFGSSVTTGDASAGTANHAINFNQAGGPRSSRIYSLEQISIFSDDVVTRVGRLEQVNLEGPANRVFRGIMGITLLLSVDGISMNTQDEAFLPRFLGSQRDPALVASIAFVIANIENVVTTFEVAGYWWGPRSVLVPGGPQRPLNGMFG